MALHTAGYDPGIGYYHQISLGRESLACDLIEPLRPSVDEWIWRQFSSAQLRAEHFGSDKGACLLGKAGRGHFYAGWEQFAPAPRRWLRQACARLARQLRAEGEPWLEHFDDDEDF